MIAGGARGAASQEIGQAVQIVFDDWAAAYAAGLLGFDGHAVVKKPYIFMRPLPLADC